MPGFVQIMEFDTSKIGEVEDLARQLQAEQGPAFLARKSIVTEDRAQRGHYYVIVEFDSYEEAMKNSTDPVTGKYSQKMGELLDGPMAFHDLDVVTVLEAG